VLLVFLAVGFFSFGFFVSGHLWEMSCFDGASFSFSLVLGLFFFLCPSFDGFFLLVPFLGVHLEIAVVEVEVEVEVEVKVEVKEDVEDNVGVDDSKVEVEDEVGASSKARDRRGSIGSRGGAELTFFG